MLRLLTRFGLLLAALTLISLAVVAGAAGRDFSIHPATIGDEGAYRAAPTCTLDPPSQSLMYTNAHGYWNIGPLASAGQATYLWRGDPERKYTDSLTYLGRSTLTDRAGSHKGVVYHGWVYRASDACGNTMLWFFSEAPLPPEEALGRVAIYPLFYSLDRSPPHEAIFHRYLTPGGTERFCDFP